LDFLSGAQAGIGDAELVLNESANGREKAKDADHPKTAGVQGSGSASNRFIQRWATRQHYIASVWSRSQVFIRNHANTLLSM
jgi:hypothetical protein